MTNDEKVYDITIIGGGPVGLFTAFYAGMRQMSVKIIESLPQLGGQLSALYPEKYIYDVAGFPKIKAQNLIDNLVDQMNQFDNTVAVGQSVEKVNKMNDNTFKLTTDKEIHYTKTIVITAGNGAFTPRKIKVEKAEQFEQSNLHYFINNLNLFKNKRVAVFGGGDSAVDWSLMLEPISDQVTIVHRRDKFRAHEHSVDNLKKSRVNIFTPYVPTELIGDDKINQIKLQEVKGSKTRTLEVDEVICNFGFVSALGPITTWGLNIEKNSIVVNSKMETNIDGIYAVGDINTYDGKVKLIATGFGEAPIAVSSAKVFIDPNAKTQPLHSTSIMGEQAKSKKTATNV